MFIQRLAILVISGLLSVSFINTAYSKGCVKGAIVGGITGHFVGHHGLLGAVAGCTILHHQESKKDKLNPSASSYPYTYQNQNRQYSQPQRGINYY